MKRNGLLRGLKLLLLLGLLGCSSTQKTPVPGSQPHLPSILEGASAHWVTTSTLLWDATPGLARYELRFSTTAEIHISAEAVQGGETVLLVPTLAEPDIKKKYSHLNEYSAFKVSATSEQWQQMLQSQLVAVAFDDDNKPVKATRVQFPGVLDQLYSYTGHLGVAYLEDGISVAVWAPTAQEVHLTVYDAEKNVVSTLTNGARSEKGVWTFTGPRSWDKQFYRFSLKVFHPENDKINTFEVTDPYAVSVSTDSHYAQFVDIYNDATLKPAGWDQVKKSLPKWTDISIYEAHVRDFSVLDASTPEAHRGRYKAFAYNGVGGKPLSVPMQHLIRLQQAGLTHLHLLPINDLGSNNESAELLVDITDPFERLYEVTQNELYKEASLTYGKTPIIDVFRTWAKEDPLTEKIQALYSEGDAKKSFRVFDTFNWGYDPFHFLAPEGVYATNPEGTPRIVEVREMVQAVHEIGLKMVVDVVFNHTFEGGMDAKSVLDKVVPWYYQRLNPQSGEIETSTCCFNTAAEHYMMEKLLIDAVVLWAKAYKIDSFRFDLMGHHPRYVMEHLQEELAKLTLEKDGVDGKNIYIYGEGWNFGEVANNRLFKQATQFNLGGTGIGNFNDRLRDGVKGGTFTDRGRLQGFANGRYSYPNEESKKDEEAKGHMMWMADNIRVGLAGNLSTYRYINRNSEVVNSGKDEIGYTLRPEENVNYIDKHDNETFWDNTQPKLPMDMNMDERVRVHVFGQSFVNFGQGVPFHQMGTDILRSKSMDRNSYNSGDWFNVVDFTMETNNWATGLPPKWDNESRWADIRAIMSNPAIRIEKKHMMQAHQAFLEQLQLRYSSPLFRLERAEDIHTRVQFHNTGKEQVPGLIVMSISDGACAGMDIDPELDAIVLVFNANRDATQFSTEWKGFELHPMQQKSLDEVVKQAAFSDGTFTVPALTTAVFVKKQSGKPGAFGCNSL